jgi:4-hydroxy-tetrahydrodipicolinate synthase
MTATLISGVYAAIGTPRQEDGQVNAAMLQKSAEFLVSKGVAGLAVNGATGEYCLTQANELPEILSIVGKAVGKRAQIVCGIGAAGIHGCLRNAEIARDSGATAVLLPMPHFFRYDQDDLHAFCCSVADQSALPVMLYNLPFASQLTAATVTQLISSHEKIIGIKDSSGTIDILQALTKADVPACRIVGSDGILQEALTGNYCNGVISGVASVLPDLILNLFAAARAGNTETFRFLASKLDEFIESISIFPVPWGLKIIGEISANVEQGFSQPLSSNRLRQAETLRKWFAEWQASLEALV